MDTDHKPHRSTDSDPASGRSDRDAVPERQRRARNLREKAKTASRRKATIPASGVSASLTLSSKSLWLRGVMPLLILLLLAVTQWLPAQEEHAPLTSAPLVSPLNWERLAFGAAVVVLLILLSAFFAVSEIALITVRRTRIHQLVEENNRSAKLVEKLLAHPTRLMATIQTGVTLVATFSAAIAAVIAVGPLAAWLHAHGSKALAASATPLALILVILPVSAFLLVFGQVAPKSLAAKQSERLALLVVHPIRWLQLALSPVVTTLEFLAQLLVRPFGGTASFTTPAVNEEELKMLVEASEEKGVLETEEKDMITSILNFGDTVVRKVMTPRPNIVAVEVDTPMPELITRIGESGHSRIPVYKEDLDEMVGVVHAKDLLTLPANASRDATSIRSVMRPPYIIPETKKIDELLAEFRRARQQMAIVCDEYGIISGLVTIEDLLEEIVGDIRDEYDKEETPVQVIDERTTILDGGVSLRDVNERMGLELPEDEWDTIGGFVFGLLGHQAQAGETACWDDVDFRVEATDSKRILKVRMIRQPEPTLAENFGLAYDRHEEEATEPVGRE